MSEIISSQNNPKNDEIDLMDLFRRMGKGISRGITAIGRAIIISLVFMIRRWIPLAISIVVGIAISISLWKSSASFYTSDMVLRVNIKPTDEVIAHINRLHTYCVELNKSFLANAIGLNSKQTDNIRDIQAFWVIDNGHDEVPDYVDYENDYDVYDTINLRMGDRLNIRVRIHEPQELSNVRDGILNFVNTETLFQQRNQLRLRQNNEMLARVKYDITQLDSLQKVKYFEEARNLVPKGGGQMIFLQEQRTQLLHPEIYDLYTRKQALEINENLYKDAVTILSDFTVPSERDNGGLYYTIRVVPIIFAFVLIILLILANRKILLDVYEKY